MSRWSWEDALPSEYRLKTLADAIEASLLVLPEDRREAMLREMGSRAWDLVARPPKDWAHRLDEVPSACMEDAITCGLWVREGERVRPRDRSTPIWLAARWLNQQGLTDRHLLHATGGMRFDAVAMAMGVGGTSPAVAAITDLPAAPMEFLSGATASQQLYALSLGASAPDDLRRELLDLALAWTSPDGREPHALLASAALAAERRGASVFKAYVTESLADRHESILSALSHRIEPGVEALLRKSLAWTCEALVVSCADDHEALSGWWEATPGHRDLVLDAVGRNRVLGEGTDACLVELVGRALQSGESGVLKALGYLTAHTAETEDLLLASLVRARTESAPAIVGRALEASEVIAGQSDLSDTLAYALSRLVVSDADPLVRVAASRALAQHPDANEAYDSIIRPTMAHLLRHATEPAEQAVAAAASMYLGSEDLMAPAMAVGLVADGISPTVLSPALAHGLSRTPELVAGLLQVWMEQDRALCLAVTTVLEDTVAAAFEERQCGVMGGANSPLSSAVTEPLLRLFLPSVGDVGDPDLCGAAAQVCAGLGRGRAHVSDAISLARQVTGDHHELASVLNVALGSAGVVTPEVVSALGRDVVEGASQLAVHGAIGLQLVGDVLGDYEVLDDAWWHRLHVQLTAQPPLKETFEALAFTLARKPLGHGVSNDLTA